MVPALLTSALNSKACRYAIKFGDALSHQACVQLVDELSRWVHWGVDSTCNVALGLLLVGLPSLCTNPLLLSAVICRSSVHMAAQA